MLLRFIGPPYQQSDMTLMEMSQHAYDFLYIRGIWLFVLSWNLGKFDIVLVSFLLNKLSLSESEFEGGKEW